MSRRAPALAAGSVALLAGALLGLGSESSADERGRRAPGKDRYEHGCLVQSPQPFLERRAFVHKGVVDGAKHGLALRYLASHYGNAGDPETMRWSTQSASDAATTVRFFGLPVSVHAKIAPALRCVEKRIRQTCTGRARYTPQALGGFRLANTYRGPELSNHLLGLAIDVDPDRNPCCGCIAPWSSSALCKEGGSVFERAALPKCWVRAFKRFGFDWLGNDELEDTMHFEFLGDPDRITK
jgi:hypothetical protein